MIVSVFGSGSRFPGLIEALTIRTRASCARSILRASLCWSVGGGTTGARRRAFNPIRAFRLSARKSALNCASPLELGRDPLWLGKMDLLGADIVRVMLVEVEGVGASLVKSSFICFNAIGF